MLKKSTFRIEFGKSFLHAVEWINDLDQSIRYETFDLGFESITEREYDERGHLISERHLEGDTELNRIEYTYDSENRGTGQKTFIADELYEEVVIHHTENGYVSTTFQEGKETERHEQQVVGHEVKGRYFIEGHLEEVHLSEFDASANSQTFEVCDREGKLITRIIHYFNDDDLLLRQLTYNEDERLISDVTHEYEGEQLWRTSRKNEQNNFELEIQTVEFDERGNVIKSTVENSSGNVIEMETYLYDDQHRVCEEQRFSNDHAGHIDFGLMRVGNSVQLKYTYETIDV